MSNPAMQEIQAMIEPPIEAMGFELVRVSMQSMHGRDTLQIMADRADGTLINVDDCAEISRTVSAVLDVEDPIPGEYNLEVSSPGIDRPLTRMKDFARWAGFHARIELVQAVDGRKRYKGLLGGIDDLPAEEGNWVLMTLESGDTVSFNFDGIETAKLILTDALIEASQVASGVIQSDDGDASGEED
jgi:ribosome maturation factor RimP